ncbi:MAG: MerR family transcriptional regulator [Lachnospiraceae bacterium]|nr:MerR family transcriptional regulator [Lachnospiraceae bacterium]
MSKYTTGEIAKLCGVSVRTVQYYDTRGILTPSELSEGGRRLYSENDFKRMKIICFLRNAGIPINSIKELLSEDDPGSVVSALLEQQERLLREEISERQAKLHMLDGIKRELKSVENFSIESISDIAYALENKKKMRQLHTILLIIGIPVGVIQWTTIILWIATGIWQPFLLFVLAAVPCTVWVSNYYFKRVAYICPQCHAVFKPRFKEAFFAKHTPTLRKLTCTCCGHKGFCVETYGKEKNKNG